MTCELAVFDLDGTLADTFPFFLEVINELADKHGFRKVRPEDIESLRAGHARDVLRALDIPWWKAPAVGQSLRERMAAHAAKIRPFPEALAMLDRLRQSGLRLGLLTSNSQENAARILGEVAFGAFEHRRCKVGLFRKRARLKELLRQSGVPASKAVHVGDELRDLEAARSLGMPYAAVSWGYTAERSLAKAGPDHLVHSFEELEQLLRP